MKIKDIRNLSGDELNKKVSELKNELFNLRFQLATGQLDNPSTIKSVKKTSRGSRPSKESASSTWKRRRNLWKEINEK